MPIVKFIFNSILFNQRTKKEKRNYKQRIKQVEQGSFSPLVFSVYGVMGREFQTFYSRLSQLLAEKHGFHKSCTGFDQKFATHFAYRVC